MSQLSEYIKALLHQGYDIDTIKNYLFQYGYSAESVKQATDQVYHTTHHISFSKSTLAVLVAIICMIGLTVGVFLFKQVSKTPELLDVKVDILTPELEAGDDLKFNVDIFNMGGVQTYDVEMRYEVYDSSNQLAAVKTESIALQTQLATSALMNIPSKTPPGIYILQVKAYYNSLTASASSSFALTSAVCTPDCTGKTCGDNGCGGYCGICAQGFECEDTACTAIVVPIVDIVPEPSTEPEQAEEPLIEEPTTTPPEANDLASLKELATTDINSAIQGCRNTYDTDSLKNVCFVSISYSSKSDKPCGFITDVSEKDQCYNNYVMDTKDRSACEKIENSQIKSWCLSTV